MKRFQSVLVGVDLSDGERPLATELSDSTRSAVDRAMWLARQADARLTFFSCVMPCLDLSHAGSVVESQHLQDSVDRICDEATATLQRLVEDARAFGVPAQAMRSCGRAWVELLRMVDRHEHDLVIVGSHRRHALGRLLLGSTGRRLIRKCPSPVWVTSPHEGGAIRRILATTDFSETGNTAVEIATSLAEQLDAELHVLHAVHYPHEAILKVGEVAVSQLDEYRAAVMAEAKKDFQAMLINTGAQTRCTKLHRHLVSGDAEQCIETFATEEQPDLIVMGTSAHSGLTGMLFGHTAEHVLPHVRCSVLAVKPVGFQCPVKFEPDDAASLVEV